jgi:energy-converting hydrogenase A subunit R
METSPVGIEEKAGAVMDVCKKTGVGVEDTMYVGDGITDSQALRLVRKGGGLALAFNGNHDAVREADVAVMSGSTVVTSVLAEAFYKGGKDAVLDLADNWTIEGVKRSGAVHDYLVRELERTFPGGLPNLARVSASNVAEVARNSATFRAAVRGERA